MKAKKTKQANPKIQGHNRELLRGNTDAILLFLIDVHGQAYGYQLIKDIEQRSKGYFRFREGTVYPALHKLEDEGLIQGEWKNLLSGLQRRIYRITPKGKEILETRLDMWQQFSGAMNLILKES